MVMNMIIILDNGRGDQWHNDDDDDDNDRDDDDNDRDDDRWW